MQPSLKFYLRTFASSVWSSFWLIPTACTIFACFLSWLLIWIDINYLNGLRTSFTWLFGGTPDGSRSVLIAVASSLITTISVIFSVTILALQQASSQYSPRILRKFSQDRGSQITFGVFIGTFVFSILVMRQIRSSTDQVSAFVPVLAVTFTAVLTLVCVGFLIYFVHHIFHSIQFSYTLESILHDTSRHLEVLLSERLENDASEPESSKDLLSKTASRRSGKRICIKSPKRGFIQRIDENAFQKVAKTSGVRFIHVLLSVGDYVFKDSHLVEVWSVQELSPKMYRDIIEAFTINIERSLNQDALFGMKIIVDIALKALSPTVNDPTTAEECINGLSALLCQILDKKIPSALKKLDGCFLLIEHPDLSDYFNRALGQIRVAAQNQAHVVCTLLKSLQRMEQFTATPHRLELIIEEVRRTQTIFNEGAALPLEKTMVSNLAMEVLSALSERHRELQSA